MTAGPAWPPVVRACHGALALCVGLAFLVWDDGGPNHRAVGYAALAVVGLRWAAGLVLRAPGRLAAMRPSLARSLAYVRACRMGPPPREAGHDPLALWMVWALWGLVVALGVTGWMLRLDAFWGDEPLQAVHRALSWTLVGAVAVHVLAVGVMSRVWRENLLRGIVLGRRGR